MPTGTLWARVVRALRGRYVCALEDEIARERTDNTALRDEVSALRAENRALVNSLLGTAGIPPIEPAGAAESRSAGPTGPATRRRSWSQIALTREIDATRKAAVREKHTVSPGAP
jgi:hypothetical protein